MQPTAASSRQKCKMQRFEILGLAGECMGVSDGRGERGRKRELLQSFNVLPSSSLVSLKREDNGKMRVIAAMNSIVLYAVEKEPCSPALYRRSSDDTLKAASAPLMIIRGNMI